MRATELPDKWQLLLDALVKDLYQIEPTEDECEAILFARAFAKE